MFQNKSNRGRPKCFDDRETLQSIMSLFWHEGYPAVGYAQLEAATGLNRSSLYNSFGAKEELFQKALANYLENVATPLFAILLDGRNGLSDLRDFTTQVGAMLNEAPGRGCLVVNSMAGPLEGQPDIRSVAGVFMERLRAALTVALERSVRLGEISAPQAKGFGQIVFSALMTANLLSRGRRPPEEIETVLAAPFAFLGKDGSNSET